MGALLEQLWSDEQLEGKKKRRRKELLYLHKPSKEQVKKMDCLLTLYPQLMRQVERAKREITLLKEGILLPPETSKSIVLQNGQATKRNEEQRKEEYVRGKIETLKKTVTELELIDEALDEARRHEGFAIIELRYFKTKGYLNDEEITDLLDISRTTYYRWRQEMLSMMAVVLFGEIA